MNNNQNAIFAGLEEQNVLFEMIRSAVTVNFAGEFIPLGEGAPIDKILKSFAAEGAPLNDLNLAPPGIPQALTDLPIQISRTYDLSTTAAGDLNIPVVGSVSGGFSRRVVVLERTAYKEILEGESRLHYGYAIRLAVTVNKVTAEAKLSLPFLAASAELGQIEAKWVLQVVGLAGVKIDQAILPPKELNLETFVLANQSLGNLIVAINDPTTKFTAQLISIIKPANTVENEYVAAVGRAYALGQIKRGRMLGDALRRLGAVPNEMLDSIRDAYKDFAGIASEVEAPNAEARSAAQKLLGPIDIDS